MKRRPARVAIGVGARKLRVAAAGWAKASGLGPHSFQGPPPGSEKSAGQTSEPCGSFAP